MTPEEIVAFLEIHFPQAVSAGFDITHLDESGLTLSLHTSERHLRPGGTVSGPTLMTMADTAAYFLVLARLGPRALAVTSSLEIHFLRKPLPGTLRATCRPLKFGGRSVVTTVEIHANEDSQPVAFATVSYAVPPTA